MGNNHVSCDQFHAGCCLPATASFFDTVKVENWTEKENNHTLLVTLNIELGGFRIRLPFKRFGKTIKKCHECIQIIFQLIFCNEAQQKSL